MKNNLAKDAYLQKLKDISSFGYSSKENFTKKTNKPIEKEKHTAVPNGGNKSSSVSDLIGGKSAEMLMIEGGYGFIKKQIGGRKVNGKYTNSPFFSTGFGRANNRKFYKMIAPFSRSRNNDETLNALSKINNKKRKHRIPYAMSNIHGYTQSLSHSGIINAVVHENIHPGNVPFTLAQIKLFDDVIGTLYWDMIKKKSKVKGEEETFSIVKLLSLIIPTMYIYDQSKDIDNYTINYKKMEDQLRHENPSFDGESKPEYFINEDRLSQITMQIILGNTRESTTLQKY